MGMPICMRWLQQTGHRVSSWIQDRLALGSDLLANSDAESDQMIVSIEMHFSLKSHSKLCGRIRVPYATAAGFLQFWSNSQKTLDVPSQNKKIK